MMQNEGYDLWDFYLNPDESPHLKLLMENLCRKLGKCGATMNSKKYHTKAVFKEPPEILFTGIPSQMIVVRIPNLSVQSWLIADGQRHKIVDGNFVISLKRNRIHGS